MRSAPNTPSIFNEYPPEPPYNWYERTLEWADRHMIAGRVERFYPLVIAVVSGLVAGALFHSSKALDTTVSSVLPTALSVVSIYAGFQSISLSIMIAASTTDMAKRLSQWGELPRVADYLKASILAVALFAVVGIGFLTINSLGVRLPRHAWVELGLLGFTFAWAILTTIRLSLIMVKFFRYYLERLGK